MNGRWRLVYGEELDDIEADPGQRGDVAEQHPEIAARLWQAHEDWWAEPRPLLDEYCPINIRHSAAPVDVGASSVHSSS